MDSIRTPHKVDRLVLAPTFRHGDFDCLACDCPFPFRHGGRFQMLYVGYDGIGYRTGLASSSDLLHWEREGMVLDRGPRGSVTEHNAALTCILRESDLFGPGELRPVGGRYLGTYHAYPGAGYEVGPAAIGLCWSRDLRHWEVEQPILRAEDGAAWERGGLYKSCLLEHAGRYYLFYNAKDRDAWPWHEQIGLAWSDDLRHWTRHEANPILPSGPAGAFDEQFAADPQVLRAGDQWVMFYYGLSAGGRACDGAAFSDDFLHWRRPQGGRVLIEPGPPGSIDSRYAHKPGVIATGGNLYHFYCAVRPAAPGETAPFDTPEIRRIALATSRSISG
jgi:predicted GH43/DUF377 family glycosyl hydrolase